MPPNYQIVRYLHNQKTFPADKWLLKNAVNITFNWFSKKFDNVIYGCESVVADYKNKDKDFTMKYYLANCTCIARDKLSDLQKTNAFKSTGNTIKTNTEQISTTISEYLEDKFGQKNRKA